MTIYEILSKKRDGGCLTPAEIQFVVRGITNGTIADYQAAAFLMAVFIRGMDRRETSALSASMTASGGTIALSSVKLPKIDKHSTGGVGDGTSLVVAPLCAAAGIAVPMMSGRTLGHTGGTLDKLESIPGFDVNLTETQYRKQLEKIGVAMIGQTAEVAPADKILYALRDVTATVDSIPLIAASIMSKKLAEGSDGIVLDVKTGNGAFMNNIGEARELAKTMIAIGNAGGKKMRALITDMSQPLGFAVGNALEIQQAIETMQGRGPADFTGLCVELSARMLVLAKAEKTLDAARVTLRKLLSDGSALDKFARMIDSQGGKAGVIDHPDKYLCRASKSACIRSERSGFVSAFDTRAVGLAAVSIGAGRRTKADRIDHTAGFVLRKKIGDSVLAGEPLAEMFYNARSAAAEAKKNFKKAVVISSRKPRIPELIYEEH